MNRSYVMSVAAAITFVISSVSVSSGQNQESHIRFKETLARIPGSDAARFVRAFQGEGATVFLYAPKGTDDQKPDTRDEIYIVASGEGTFFDGHKTFSFTTGDILFVPAQVDHRFVTFSNNFSAWVVFYGAEKKP